jgi:phosphate:Na+ symporter
MMNLFDTAVAVTATLSLFLFSLKGFSAEIQMKGFDSMKGWLSKITQNRFKGFVFGAFLTAAIQSSSAVSSIVVALVDSGVIAFHQSLAVLLGSNLGSTFTAWLVSFKLEFLGAYLLVVGTLVGAIPFRIQYAGRLIFYVGLILFSLQLVGQSLTPIKDSDEVLRYLSYAENPIFGLVIGTVVTFLVQSSSVTTGLTIVLATQGLMGIESAVAIVLGCNVGTTGTSIIAAVKLGRAAKMAALGNLFFNLLGLLLFAPFIHWIALGMNRLDTGIGIQIALVHLGFNLVVALVTFPFLKQIAERIESIKGFK